MDPGEVMAELCGKQSGVSKGKGGSMHLFDKRRSFLGGHGIVGGQIPAGAGTAFAAKYLKQPRVTLCFFGEAAVNIGSFHESLNLAALWKLPVIFICENNRFGMGTPIERASSLYELSQKACAYNMARTWVDGMDVLAVRETLKEAVDRARKDKRPHADRSAHLPLHGPLHVRPLARPLPHQGGSGRAAPARSHQTIQRRSGSDRGRRPGVSRRARPEECRDTVEEAVAFAERSPEPDATGTLHGRLRGLSDCRVTDCRLSNHLQIQSAAPLQVSMHWQRRAESEDRCNQNRQSWSD